MASTSWCSLWICGSVGSASKCATFRPVHSLIRQSAQQNAIGALREPSFQYQQCASDAARLKALQTGLIRENRSYSAGLW